MKQRFIPALMLCALVAIAVIVVRVPPVPVVAPAPVERAPDLRVDPLPVTIAKPAPVVVAINDCEQYAKQVELIAREVWGNAAPTARLIAQLEQESRCSTIATSSAGARGMAQFMPATAELMARRYPELAPADPTSARWAMRAQAYLMRDLLAYYDSAQTECDRWQLALAAYNGGETALNRERRIAASKSLDPDVWYGNVRPQRSRRASAWAENRDYVDAILLRREPALRAVGHNSGVQSCIQS